MVNNAKVTVVWMKIRVALGAFFWLTARAKGEAFARCRSVEVRGVTFRTAGFAVLVAGFTPFATGLPTEGRDLETCNARAIRSPQRRAFEQMHFGDWHRALSEWDG